MLSDTLRRYLSVVQPLVTPVQYNKTVEILREFERSEGPRLHEELLRTDRANLHTSYISSDWFEKVLKERDPIPLRRHTTLVMQRNAAGLGVGIDAMLTSATRWTVSTVLFYKRYLDNELSPDLLCTDSTGTVYYRKDWFARTIALCPEYFSASLMTLASNFHALPLDLSQNDNMFNSTRRPGVLQDEIKAVGFMPHIVVQYHGHQYFVTVADSECNPLPASQIYARLRAIVDLHTEAPQIDVSLFTALPRTEWSAVRTSLLRDVVNQKSLELTDTSMFVLNLDDDVNGNFFGNPEDLVQEQAIRPSMRWWDKSLSVNVSYDGTVSVGYEESWGDGGAVRRYAADVFQDSLKRSTAEGVNGSLSGVIPTEAVRQAAWRLPKGFDSIAVRARARLNHAAQQTDVSMGLLAGFPIGATAALTDGLLQLAIQLAWWRLNTSPVSCCQYLGMATYRRGRTDTLFGATTASQDFVMAMTVQSSSDADRRERCLRALNVYNTALKEVAAGNGIGAHLFALGHLSRRLLGKTSALHADPSFDLVCHPDVVCSPVYVEGVQVATANPTARGYGVSYTWIGDQLVLNVTSRREGHGPRHSSDEFATALIQSVQDINHLHMTSA